MHKGVKKSNPWQGSEEEVPQIRSGKKIRIPVKFSGLTTSEMKEKALERLNILLYNNPEKTLSGHPRVTISLLAAHVHGRLNPRFQVISKIIINVLEMSRYIFYAGTIRSTRIGMWPLMIDKELRKKGLRSYDYRLYKDGVIVFRWYEKKTVTLACCNVMG
ncbi:unnamed protein product [Lepeophtheirus salmonis]|uniref:(salmon louse) hypothetical protein n=1 Tax=Lepeophtheirus salmonis TaxID=72036 RepID=A0A7R8CII1_LEPSM|nr:unnamed protein product [Lepeophtheirus salmonis]CAF2827126.1 unnamed protein product [Lepeophtheirus salmonis]